jgi:ribosomal protein S9
MPAALVLTALLLLQTSATEQDAARIDAIVQEHGEGVVGLSVAVMRGEVARALRRYRPAGSSSRKDSDVHGPSKTRR